MDKKPYEQMTHAEQLEDTKEYCLYLAKWHGHSTALGYLRITRFTDAEKAPIAATIEATETAPEQLSLT
jgi:hypothetical protein